MFSDHPGRHDVFVVITIELDGTDPPTGRVCRTAGNEVAFVGWLGLLRALSDLVERSDP